MTRFRTILVVLVVAAAVAVTIGWTASTGSETKSDTTGMASTAPSAESDVVETAAKAGDFTTLTKLLTRAGLAETLRQPGPYTVLAPTDTAFAGVPKETLDALLRDDAKLKTVLLYHVLSGEVTAADVVKLRSAKTASGDNVRIRVAGSDVFVNRAKVTQPDVMASNGVIHVIDRVLIPPMPRG